MDGTVLITGALGQDGWLLARRLVEEGHEVVGLVRPGSAGGRPAPCRLAEIDLGDAAAIDRIVRELRPARVFHIAAAHHSAEVPLAADPELWRAMTTVNHVATTLLIQAILGHAPECRLVYAASSQMYRPGDADRVIDAASPRDPATYYGLTKMWAMDAIRYAREQFGLRGGTAILFNHESPLRPESFVSRKISAAAARIRRGLARRLELRNVGARADWFAAEDAVDAMLRLSLAGRPADYAVGSGRASGVRDLLDAAFSAVGLDWREHVDAQSDIDRPTLVADVAPIGRDLGWAPREDIRDTLRRMALADLDALA
ncbi:GDP-mannose 4,6-dehydratase [Azospirillum sp. TSO22-1]|uniref:GDP-mannose 4,6-dehydratase n=1 Tax=Azospirillum sp. TSO22-1 TaxID=716789 RepID=UPI000D615192|nr:GDP-mannose 4,6-dehydratase [Azospirillum sp. TSO22-1]PWC40136.1 hypothetical protein TSO221_25810 [Azospirillum sp. TSO22-1]